MSILGILFLAMEGAYLLHCFEEYLAGGGFVQGVRRHIWTAYNTQKFLATNTVLHLVHIAAILLYWFRGGGWVIFPLIMGWFFVTNTVWHWWWTLRYREYSPGLTTGHLYWVVMGLLSINGLATGEIGLVEFIVSLIAGCLLTVLLVSTLYIGAKLTAKS